MTVLSITDAWRTGRSKVRRKERTATLVTLVAFLARVLPTWKRFRSTVLQVAAFVFIDYAMFQWTLIAGLLSVGISLLVLEALGGEK